MTNQIEFADINDYQDYKRGVLFLILNLQQFLSDRGLAPPPELIGQDENGKPLYKLQSISRQEWDMETIYTESASYLLYTTLFHLDRGIHSWLTSILPALRLEARIADVGCASGLTGLTLALAGRRQIEFLDYEGLGGEFLRWALPQLGLDQAARFVPYGQEGEAHYDYVLALDVLEHTGNHLLFLEWLSRLGDRVILSYPLMPFYPAYEAEMLDEWVDDQAIMTCIGMRHNIIISLTDWGRRFVYFAVRREGQGARGERQ